MNSTNVIDILTRSNLAGLNAANGALKQHESILRSTLNTAASAGKAAYGAAANITAIAGAAIAAFTGASINAAARFGEQLAVINTIAQTTPAALGRVGDQIRLLASKTGEPLDTLTQGFYDLLSAGIKSGQAMGVLRAATTLAIGGLATTAQTVDLLTTAINAWGLKARDATRISDAFAVAIDKGKVTADQIAGSLFNVAPLAAKMGIGIEQVAASYATMTSQGIPAEQLTVAMRSALLSLQAPTKQLIDAQNTLGVSFAKIAQEKGLHVAMRQLVEYADDTGIPLYKLLGRVEALQYAFAVSGKGAALFDEALKETTKGFEGNGYAALQAAARMNTLPRAMGQLRASVADLMIEWGDAFLPGIIKGVQAVTGVVQAITAWMRANRELVRSWAPVIALLSGIFALRLGAESLLTIFTRLGPFIGVSGRLSVGFGRILSLVGALAFPIGLLVTAFFLLQRGVEAGAEGFERFRSPLAAVTGTISTLVRIARNAGRIVGEIFRGFGRGEGLAAIGKAVDRFGGRFDTLFARLGANLFSLRNNAQQVFMEFWPKALGVAGAAIANLFDVPLTAVMEVLNDVSNAVGAVIVSLFRLGEAVLPLVGRAARWVLGRFVDLFNASGEGESVFRILANVIVTVVDALTSLAVWLDGTTEGAATARLWIGRLATAFLALYGLNKVLGVIEGVIGQFVALGQAVASTFAPLVHFTRLMARVTGKTIRLAVRGIDNAVDLVSTLVEKMGRLKDKAIRVSIRGAETAGKLLDGLKLKLGDITGEAQVIRITAPSVALSGGQDIFGGLMTGLGAALGSALPGLLKGVKAADLARGLGGLLLSAVPLLARAGPWGLLAAAVIGGLALAIVNPKLVGQMIGGLGNLLRLAVEGLIAAPAWIIQLGINLLGGFGEAIAWVVDRIADIDIDLPDFLDFGKLWDAITRPFREVIDRFGEFWTQLWEEPFDPLAILGALGNLGLAIIGVPLGLVAGIGGWLIEQLILQPLGWLGDRLGEIDWGAPFRWIGDNLLGFLPDIDIGKWWDDIVSGITDGLLKDVHIPMPPWVGQFGDFLKDPLNNFTTWLGETFGPAIQGFSDWWNSVWTGVGSFIASVWDGIVHAVGVGVSRMLIPLELLLEVLDDLPGPLQDSASAAKESIQGIVRSMENWGESSESSAQTFKDSMAGAAKAPGSLSDAMTTAVNSHRANVQKIADRTEWLKTHTAQSWTYMTKISRLGGEEFGGGYAGGVSSPVNRTKSFTAGQVIAGRAKDGLSSVDASGGGASIISSWVSGMLVQWYTNSIVSVQKIAANTKAILGGSLPEAGPLKGDTAFRGGRSIMQSWVAGMASIREQAVATATSVMSDVSMALAQPITGQFALAGDGRMLPNASLGGYAGIPRGMDGDGRDVELLNELVNETKVQSRAMARMAARDPEAAGPLSAFSTLEVLRTMEPARG